MQRDLEGRVCEKRRDEVKRNASITRSGREERRGEKGREREPRKREAKIINDHNNLQVNTV